MRAVRLLVWAAGGALCATLMVGSLMETWPRHETAVITYSAAFAEITIGVLVWQLRPDTRTGILLTGWAFAAILPDLHAVLRASALAMTVGYATVELAVPLLGQLVLSYPTGHLDSRVERVAVGAAYGYAAVAGLVYGVLYDPRPAYSGTILELETHAVPYTHVALFDPNGVIQALNWTLAVLAVAFLALLARKAARATPGGRRVVLPLVLSGCFIAVQYVVQMALFGQPVNSWRHHGWFWVVIVAELGVPVSLAAGLLWGRRARAGVADLVVELERTPPGSIRDVLARTLGDPTLEVALWLPERSAYVDGHGRPVELPVSDPGRAVTVLGPPDAPVAALAHDPALLERPKLLAAAGAAARLALENERLQAALRVQLAELRASRARIVSAGDEERRRLERDLHDGAQQRLLSLGLALQLARSKLGPDADGAADLLAEADSELQAALDELRELARGIHPAVLTEHGLGAALRSLAERSPVPVTIVDAPTRRYPASAEAAAYFLVSEALANAAKHARASRVVVRVAGEDERVLVDVSDDGVGGADPSRGSGLRGLADRVYALDGRLELESQAGRGTRLHVEIPCA
jgi:signal transduction histidine kinase